MKRLLLIIVLLLLPGWASAQTAAEQGQLISQEEMTQVLDDFLADESDRLPGVELRFASLDLPESFKVPAGVLDFQVIPAKPDVIGSHRLTFLIRVDGEIASNRSVRVSIEAMADILVAASNLRRGKILGEEDVVFQREDISKLKQPLFSADEIIGKRLKRSVRLGKPLLKQQVEFPPLIKRGDRVVIQAQRGGLILTAAGEARQDGLEGETIRVMNISSRKEVLCRVLAPGLVSVEF